MPIQNAVGSLRSVFVRAPAQPTGAWKALGWHAAPDPVGPPTSTPRSCRARTSRRGVVIGTTPVPGDPDAIYAYDPVLMTDRGVMLRCREPGRQGSPTRSVPICGRRGERARVAGHTGDGRRGDMLWLDERNLLVGRGIGRTTTASPSSRPCSVRRSTSSCTTCLLLGPGVPTPDVVHLAPRSRPRGGVPADDAGPTRGAPARAGRRGGGGSRPRARVAGAERARARATGRARAGGNPETADAWNARGSTCVRSWATRSRGRRRRADLSPDRSTAPDPRGQQPLGMLPRDVRLLGPAAHPGGYRVRGVSRGIDVRALPDPRAGARPRTHRGHGRLLRHHHPAHVHLWPSSSSRAPS